MKYDRQAKIRQLFITEKKLSCAELCSAFGISVETVRRDLAALEKEGIIRRVYGGGVLRDNTAAPNPIPLRAVRNIQNSAEKVNIAAEVVRHIADGMTVALDSGTTLMETAKQLRERKDLKIITNDIHIASELSSQTDHTIFFAGGMLNNAEMITTGFLANEFLENFSRIDAAVLTADGFADGLWDFNMDMAALKAIMVRKADKVIAAVDHSKFAVDALYKSCDAKDLDLIVTGKEAPEEAIASLRQAGVEVVQV